ncbi:MAG: hypothetical protein QXL94_01125 [Candidatus Parvarchaeum sp.]
MAMATTLGYLEYISKSNSKCPYCDSDFSKSYDLYDHLEMYHFKDAERDIGKYRLMVAKAKEKNEEEKEKEDTADTDGITHYSGGEAGEEGDEDYDSEIQWKTDEHLPEGTKPGENYEDVSAGLKEVEEAEKENDVVDDPEEDRIDRTYENTREGDTYYKGRRSRGKYGPAAYRRALLKARRYIEMHNMFAWDETLKYEPPTDEEELKDLPEPLRHPHEVKTRHQLYHYTADSGYAYARCRYDGLTHFPTQSIENVDEKGILVGAFIEASFSRNKDGDLMGPSSDTVSKDDYIDFSLEMAKISEEEYIIYQEEALFTYERSAPQYYDSSLDEMAGYVQPPKEKSEAERQAKRAKREQTKLLTRAQREQRDRKFTDVVNTPQPFKVIGENGAIRTLVPGTKEWNEYFAEKGPDYYDIPDKRTGGTVRAERGTPLYEKYREILRRRTEKGLKRKKKYSEEVYSGNEEPFTITDKEMKKFSYERDVDDTVKELVEKGKYMGTLGYEYKCPFDNAIFINKNGLAYHILQKHPDIVEDIVDDAEN